MYGARRLPTSLWAGRRRLSRARIRLGLKGSTQHHIDVRFASRWAGARGRLERIELKDCHSGEVEAVPAAAVFVLIGAQPFAHWLPSSVVRDQWGLRGHQGRIRGGVPRRDHKQTRFRQCVERHEAGGTARPCCSRPASLESSPSKTSARARSSASPPAPVRVPSASGSSTSTWRRPQISATSRRRQLIALGRSAPGHIDASGRQLVGERSFERESFWRRSLFPMFTVQ